MISTNFNLNARVMVSKFYVIYKHYIEEHLNLINPTYYDYFKKIHILYYFEFSKHIRILPI